MLFCKHEVLPLGFDRNREYVQNFMQMFLEFWLFMSLQSLLSKQIHVIFYLLQECTPVSPRYIKLNVYG